MNADAERVRIDRWLWAARFFKTRSLAKAAVDGGKVKLDGERCKPSRELKVGDELSILRGAERMEVQVRALSGQRGPARVAQQLYVEHPDSVARRETERLQRRVSAPVAPSQRPARNARRLIHRFKREQG